MRHKFTCQQISTTLLLLSLILVQQLAFADHTQSYTLSENSFPENIGLNTQYIEDKDGTYFLDDVMAADDEFKPGDPERLHWSPAPSDGLAKGFTDSVYWLRFSVENIYIESVRWYLEIRYPLLDSIEYYSPDKNGEYTKLHVGDSLPFDQRPIDYRNLVFLQNTKAGEKQTFYLRVKTSSSMYVPLQIWPNDTFFHEIDKVKLLLGILYGIVILALFISAVNAIFLKDIMYIWLSGIFICFFLYLAGIKGVAFQSLWSNSIYWQEISIPFFMNLSYAFGFLYCRAYINLKELSNKLDLIIKSLGMVGLVSALLCFVVDYRYIISYSTIMTMLAQVICLSIGSYSWYKGNLSARLFILSWTALFAGAVSFALIALGTIPKTFLTEWMQELGFGAMVTLMIVAQFDRFLQTQKSHEKDQIASLEAIKNAEKKYRSLFENAIEGIFQMDERGVLTNVNTAFANILGIDDPELLVETRDTPFSLGFISESEGSKMEALLNTKGALSEYKVSFASLSGELRWASIAIQKVQSNAGQSVHYEGSLTDITETKKREQAEKHSRMAEASTEAKSMFLANMSHEIRTPMNAIIGFTDLAVNANQDKNLSEFLRKIKTASSNLLGIINDILDFSKIEAGKLKIESIPFHLKELMDNIQDIVEGNIESKGLEFSIDIDEDIPEVLIGDSLRLHQILLNLTNNAVKFTPEGSVRVELDLLAMNKKKGTIKLAGRVIDTGIGISQEAQDKLFTSFSQADESTTRTFGGTGLGLSISKQLISMMGGDITVRSVENQGSVFEFSFQCRLESRRRRSSYQETKLNVLIVDDNSDSTLLIENVVSKLNCEFTSVTSAKEAIRALRTKQDESSDKATGFDLVLIDWLMPEVDGLECYKQIDANTSITTPQCILVTSYGEDGLEERALELGFNAYIEKPLKKAHLQEIVGQLFHGQNLAKSDPIASKPSVIEDTQVASLPSTDHASSSFKGIKALLVEDVAMNQELATEILRRRGIETTIANNGELGVEAARQQNFDVILMDMQMPIMDGCEATQHIKEFNESIPIIAMTANAMSEDKRRCFDAGMDDFVTKPINDKALLATIAKHLPRLASDGLDVEVKVQARQSEGGVARFEDAAIEPQTALLGDTVLEESEGEAPVVKAVAQESVEETVNEESEENEPSDMLGADNDVNKQVPLEDATTPTISPLPITTLPESLPSIDLRDGLERCQGNQKLYLKLLGDFIRNYAAAPEEMKVFEAQGDFIAISKLAHTFKGLSANLGAKTLSAYAMQLEHITDMNSTEQSASIIEFEKLLSALVTELNALLSEMAEHTSEAPSVLELYSDEQMASIIKALHQMVNEQKMDAYDQAIEAESRWPDNEIKSELKVLIEQLDLFDFESAKQTIESISQKVI